MFLDNFDVKNKFKKIKKNHYNNITSGSRNYGAAKQNAIKT
jgi:hypothetical protein